MGGTISKPPSAEGARARRRALGPRRQPTRAEYHRPMTDDNATVNDLRRGLADGLAAARATERDVLAALDPAHARCAGARWRLVAQGRAGAPRRLAAAPGRAAGGHARAAGRAAAGRDRDRRGQRDHPRRAGRLVVGPRARRRRGERDPADRRGRGRRRVDPRRRPDVGSIMGNGPSTADPLGPIAARAGHASRVLELATRSRRSSAAAAGRREPAAYARYNLACFHALGGRLDEPARCCGRRCPEQEDAARLRAAGRAISPRSATRSRRSAAADPQAPRTSRSVRTECRRCGMIGRDRPAPHPGPASTPTARRSTSSRSSTRSPSWRRWHATGTS